MALPPNSPGIISSISKYPRYSDYYKLCTLLKKHFKLGQDYICPRANRQSSGQMEVYKLTTLCSKRLISRSKGEYANDVNDYFVVVEELLKSIIRWPSHFTSSSWHHQTHHHIIFNLYHHHINSHQLTSSSDSHHIIRLIISSSAHHPRPSSWQHHLIFIIRLTPMMFGIYLPSNQNKRAMNHQLWCSSFWMSRPQLLSPVSISSPSLHISSSSLHIINLYYHPT